MQSSLPKNSVGLVKPSKVHFEEKLLLASGSSLNGFDLVYETYGKLNAQCSNAILICHALSGDHHVAGYHTPEDKKPGWWDNAIGPNKVIDTNKFFVVCPNNIGGCGGSTGPLATNPDTGELYGPNFPLVTVKDWVKTQAMLADHLGIEILGIDPKNLFEIASILKSDGFNYLQCQGGYDEGPGQNLVSFYFLLHHSKVILVFL